MLAQGIPHSVIGVQHWGRPDPRMLNTYGHLSNKQVDEILLQHAGIAPQGTTESPSLQPVQCPRCSQINPPGSRWCSLCGMALTGDAITAKDTAIAMARNSPEYQDLLEQLRNDLGR